MSVLYKTVDADMRVKAAFEHGTFNCLKIARKGSMLLQFSISGKIAMQRYARLANRFSAGQSMLPEDSYQ